MEKKKTPHVFTTLDTASKFRRESVLDRPTGANIMLVDVPPWVCSQVCSKSTVGKKEKKEEKKPTCACSARRAARVLPLASAS